MWCEKNKFDPECFEAFRSFSRRGFQQFAPYILNYFNSMDTRYTNATTEGLNNYIGDVNIAGKGYSFKHLRAKCLYAPLVRDRIIYGVDLKTIKKWVKQPDPSFQIGGKHGGYHESLVENDVKSFVFTEEKVDFGLPKIDLTADNRWVAQIFSEKYLDDLENERLKLTGKKPKKSKTVYGCKEDDILEVFDGEPYLSDDDE